MRWLVFFFLFFFAHAHAADKFDAVDIQNIHLEGPNPSDASELTVFSPKDDTAQAAKDTLDAAYQAVQDIRAVTPNSPIAVFADDSKLDHSALAKMQEVARKNESLRDFFTTALLISTSVRVVMMSTLSAVVIYFTAADRGAVDFSSLPVAGTIAWSGFLTGVLNVFQFPIGTFMNNVKRWNMKPEGGEKIPFLVFGMAIAENAILFGATTFARLMVGDAGTVALSGQERLLTFASNVFSGAFIETAWNRVLSELRQTLLQRASLDKVNRVNGVFEVVKVAMALALTAPQFLLYVSGYYEIGAEIMTAQGLLGMAILKFGPTRAYDIATIPAERRKFVYQVTRSFSDAAKNLAVKAQIFFGSCGYLAERAKIPAFVQSTKEPLRPGPNLQSASR